MHLSPAGETKLSIQFGSSHCSIYTALPIDVDFVVTASTLSVPSRISTVAGPYVLVSPGALHYLCTKQLAALLSPKDLVVGTRVNNLLISTEKVVYNALPLLRRDKDYTYKDPLRRIIKGIIARDLSRTDASATVTEGGVGFNSVTIHFQSERGKGLNYLVLIFTKNS
ncbi:unnamed protein product, partial [Iphiclides podalirius]